MILTVPSAGARERLQGQAAAEGLLIPGLSDVTGGPCDVTDGQAAERDRLHEVHKVGGARPELGWGRWL